MKVLLDFFYVSGLSIFVAFWSLTMCLTRTGHHRTGYTLNSSERMFFGFVSRPHVQNTRIRSNIETISKACRISGVGSALPDNKITNHQLSQIVDTSDEWVQTRTGIVERRILRSDETLLSLSKKAAHKAIHDSGIDPVSIDMVISCSSTPDDLFGDAPAVAQDIGASRAVGFDLTAACSGFLFGIITASQFIETGSFKRILVLGADGLSRWVDWTDRNTCILFGDGAGAVVLEKTDYEHNGVLGWVMRSDGSGRNQLSIPLSKTRAFEHNKDFDLANGRYSPLTMNGREVFRFATKEVPQAILDALQIKGMTTKDINWLLLHQANTRIMKAVAARLGLPEEKILCNLDRIGNTSAASIPICLDEEKGRIKKGDVIAVAGFGAGLSWGAAIFKWL